jgi:hypothetical protein
LDNCRHKKGQSCTKKIKRCKSCDVLQNTFERNVMYGIQLEEKQKVHQLMGEKHWNDRKEKYGNIQRLDIKNNTCKK